jgi:glycosyltransferase involved in cell wall biosynthesis
MKFFVVLGTYNRAHLLERSLYWYRNSSLKPEKVFVLDDSSTDNTKALCEEYSDIVDYEYLQKPEGVEWRDSAAFLNKGIKKALSVCSMDDVIICTHPEVIPGPDSFLELSVASCHDTYLNCKPYYLTPSQQVEFESSNWKEIGGPSAARELKDFYLESPTIAGNADYRPKAIEGNPKWESWVFGGMTAQTWKKIGGMSEHNTWGSIDVSFLARRHILGVECLSTSQPNSYCIHQNHDDPSKNVITPRDMKACHANAHRYTKPIHAICNNL